MIYSLSGTVLTKGENFAVIECGGVGLRVWMPNRDIAALPKKGELTSCRTYLNVREDGLDLYGFYGEEACEFFEMLIGVSNVGPKSALAILDVAEIGQLKAAIQENRPDLLSRAGGVGKKTAERIIVELKGSVEAECAADVVGVMEGDEDLTEALAGLGYRKRDIAKAVKEIPEGVEALEDRIKAALRILGGR